jgi:hypothetical protein
MELPNHQKQWVADHLGHDMRTHSHYYRMPIDSIECTKITKLMYLMDHCKMTDVRGLNLDQVETVLKQTDLFNDIAGDEYEDDLNAAEADGDAYGEEEETERGVAVPDKVPGDFRFPLQRKATNEIVPLPTAKLAKITRPTRETWPVAQETLVVKTFAAHIAAERVPGKVECEKFLALFPHCKGQWSRLKEKVNNLIIRNKKQQQKNSLNN